MEEQRQRQEEEQRRAQADSATEAGVTVTPAAAATASSTAEPLSDEAMLERALALSTETPVKRRRVRYFYYSFYQN